jgi:hypothetical protein
MHKRSDEEIGKFARCVRLTLAISFIIMIWIISFYFMIAGFADMPRVHSSDLSAVISGTGTIALSIFSILIAVAAIYGINSLDRKVREVARVLTKEQIARTEKELRGRSFAILGYLIGENSVKPDLSGSTDKERLKEAIYYSDRGYNILKETNLPAEYMALNNLLGYSCALQAEEKQNPRRLLKEAKRLLDAAEDHADSPGATNLLLTYARTIYIFCDDKSEISKARELLSTIDETHLNSKERADAERVRDLLGKKLAETEAESDSQIVAGEIAGPKPVSSNGFAPVQAGVDPHRPSRVESEPSRPEPSLRQSGADHSVSGATVSPSTDPQFQTSVGGIAEGDAPPPKPTDS